MYFKMLEKIKTTYFFKRLFLHIDEKIKLNLLKYNKSLQKIQDISLKDYRIFSGKYIIYEGEGIGKIYDACNDKLIFEGGILKGVKIGKGKEYDEKGRIKYIGEYSNGEIILKGNEFKEGFAKEYNYNHQLIFEGDFLNGKRNGKGKEYDTEGKIEFEGEYLNGKRNGKGKEYYFSGKLKFEGEYYYGMKWNGFGYDINNNIIYELKKGKGFIKEYGKYSILKFEGEF